MLEKKSLRKAYGETLLRLGKQNEQIVVLDADLSKSTQTARFGKDFPHRFFNMGVSEQDMISTAAGLALGGKIPFASTFAIFQTGRAWEQIRQSLCYPKVNVKLVSTHGGITVGEDGASHHCIEDIALMRVLPNMTVIMPADAHETEKAIEAVLAHKGPVYIRLSREDFPVIFSPDMQFTIGKAQTVRQGRDLTFIACGLLVSVALEAASLLEQQDIQARVINMSTIKPIDHEAIIQAAEETGTIVSAEEHSVIGGLGSAVAEVIAEQGPGKALFKRIGVCDRYGMSGKSQVLLQEFGFTAQNLAEQAKILLKRKQQAKRSSNN